MKRATDVIREFNAEQKRNGEIQRMFVALEFIPKGSDAYKKVVEEIKKRSVAMEDNE